MTLGPIEMRDFRVQAESMMHDVLELRAPNGVTSDADGMQTAGYVLRATVYGRLTGSSATSRDPGRRVVRIGEVDRPLLEAGIHLPVGTDIAESWLITCACPGRQSDPSLSGRSYLVVNVPAKSLATALRLDVVEVP